ncbi:hypothetical protein JCM8547_006194 [Rhodosporidiobolus lusitaniae]
MPAQAAAADEEDMLDLFEDSLTNLFDEYMPAKGSPQSLYTYTPPVGAPLTCRIPQNETSLNSLFAHFVWRGSAVLADAIATGAVDVEGEDVLEMGAGTGIPGLMAARSARKVVLSDYDNDAIISNLKSNISLAYPDSPDIRARLHAIGHSWGEEDSLQALLTANTSLPFTRILLADTLWYSEGHFLLLSSLSRLLARSSSARIHICAGFHSGRSTVRSFLKKARREGFIMQGKWEEVGIEGQRRDWGWDVKPKEGAGAGEGERREDEEVEGEWEEKENSSERNKWVVMGELGWSDERLQSVESIEGIE